MMANPELINHDNNDLDAIKNLSRRDKILYFLKKRNSEMSGQDLIKLAGIDKDNISKIFKVLESEGLISRRYEQVGPARLVFIKLTDSQLKSTDSLTKITDSRSRSTDSQIKKLSEVNAINSKEPELILDKSTDSPRIIIDGQSKQTDSPKKLMDGQSKTVSQNIINRDPRLLLTEENLIDFVKSQERTKVYEMKIRFIDNSASEIKRLVDSLKKREILAQNKNGWIFLKPKEGN